MKDKMTKMASVLAPCGVLLFFTGKALLPAELNISHLFEDHLFDLGGMLVAAGLMCFNLYRLMPAAVAPEPQPASQPEPAPAPAAPVRKFKRV